MSSTFPRWPNDATPRFVQDLAELAASSWNVTVLAPHHDGAARREVLSVANDAKIDVRRFRYFLPTSLQRLCYRGGILPNLRASALARLQVPCLVSAEAHAMRRLLRERTFDLVHAHFLVPQGYVASVVARGRPIVVSLHGSDLFSLRGPIDAVTRAVLAQATLITVNGRVARAEALRRFPELESRLRLLPMGVDTAMFRPPDDDEQRAPTSSPVILFVGRLSEQKGAHVLIEAFAKLIADKCAPELTTARLVIAGEGPELSRLRGLAGDRVHLVGPLSHREVAALLRTATLLVVPSLADAGRVEAQGLIAIEAMACGCPVVVTRSGGLEELVTDEGTVDAPSDPAHGARRRLAVLGRRAPAISKSESTSVSTTTTTTSKSASTSSVSIGPRGIAAPPNDATALAQAIAQCLADGAASRARAHAARAHAVMHFGRHVIGDALLAIYDEAGRGAGSRWA